MKDILNITDITTGYLTGTRRKLISNGLNLNIQSGEFIALLGPNGCGKSTLLRTIAGLQKAIQGDISIKETHIQELKGKEKARLLSLVLTDRITSAYLIVEDIVKMGRYPYTGSMGVLSEHDKDVVKHSLHKCDLDNYTHRAYPELSDGEKQRVMLARALAQDTPLMMLDEPTAHLDLPNRVNLMQMLRNLAKETNKAILLSTHELDLALQWCDGIWLMNQNGEVKHGTPEDLVLNGSFSEVFSNKSFYFDIPTGTFKMQRKSKGNIYIEGNSSIKEWTRRATEREGYTETQDKDNASIIINITTDNKWILKQNNKSTICTTIKELIQLIVDNG